MTPGARLQAVLDILDQILGTGEAGAPAADRAIADYFRSRRYAGAKDRAAIADRLYRIVRGRGALVWRLQQAGEASATPRALLLADLATGGKGDDEIAALFSGTGYAPAPLSTEERRLLARLLATPPAPPPDWARLNYREELDAMLKRRFAGRFEEEMAALANRAPLDVRVNALKTTHEAVIARLTREAGIEAHPTPLAPFALRLPAGTAVRRTPAWRRGMIEVQDVGAQVAARLVDARPGQQVVDFAAGAGGKTLALAADMNNTGQIYALDRSRARLAPIRARLERAGVRNTQIGVVDDKTLRQLEGRMDRVLVDAPCSGSGTWRRTPDLRWRYGADDIAGLAARQRALLDEAARLVAPGGRLIYVTCSLFAEENEDVIGAFLAHRPEFAPLPFARVWPEVLTGEPPETAALTPESLQLTPARHGCDGFFIAILARREADG